MVRFGWLFLLCVSASAADLIRLAQSHAGAGEMHDAIAAEMKDADLRKGAAAVSQGGNLLFALKAPGVPKLFIDEKPGPAMTQAGDLYYALANVETGRSHNFIYEVNGQSVGGKTDVPAWPTDAYK